MKPLTLNQKRVVASIWLVMFLFTIANEYLAWGIFGNSAKRIRVVVMFIGLLAYWRFGPRMIDEIYARKAAMREVEQAAERARDKSSDAADTDQIRRAIGLPLSASAESAAQQTVAADRREDASPTER